MHRWNETRMGAVGWWWEGKSKRSEFEITCAILCVYIYMFIRKRGVGVVHFYPYGYFKDNGNVLLNLTLCSCDLV